MKNIYKQVVHWKAIFFTLPRNKTGIKFTDTLNEILPATLNDSNAETAMYCAMVMPHLIHDAGDQQLCMGQKGIEYAIHSLIAAFKDTDSEAILLIDTKNAFNSFNRDIALRNIEKLCPTLYHSICNSYRGPSNLFINKQTIFSQ